MVKATLKRPVKSVVLDSTPVEVLGVKVESITTEGLAPGSTMSAGASLEDMAGETSEPATSTAVATRPVLGLPAVYTDQAGFEGEFDSGDSKLPQLKLVQGSGPLSTQFNVGTLLYADEELFPPPDKKEGAVNPVLRFVPIHIKKQYREKLSQDRVDDGEMPRIVDTKQEVFENGGVTNYPYGGDMPDNLWESSSRNILLIEKPAGSEHAGFPLELDGKEYALAVYYAAGGSYRDFVRVINSVKTTQLLEIRKDDAGQPMKSPTGHIIKDPLLWKCFWTVFFKQKKAGNFTPWRPHLKLLSKETTGAEVRAYIEQFLANFKGATPGDAEEE